MSENITTRLKRYFSSFAGSNSENQFVSILKNIPCSIEKETADRAIKRPIQALVPNSSLEGYNPPVFISYATGTRPEQDEKTCGPGMYYCKALVDGLLSIGCETFTGLHILPGYDWEIYLEKLERNVARILLVVMTPAVFQSRPCLNEIYISLKKGIKVIPLVFEYPFSCPNPWPHPEDVEKRDYVTCGLGKLNSYPVPPSTMLDDPEYHLSRVFQLVNSTLISILTRENLPAVMNSSSSSDSESSSSNSKPPFKIISINLGGAPLNVRKNPTWEKFLKSDADVLESNLTKIYSIATKRRIRKRIKVNPFRDSSGMERAVIKLDFQLRIRNQLSPDDYEDISRHLENIQDLLTQGLMELLGKTPDETKDILAKMGFKTVWPGSVNIMMCAPPVILSLLYRKLLESDGSILIRNEDGGKDIRFLKMDPVFEILPQNQEVAKLLTRPLIKVFKSDLQQADLYVVSHDEVGMFIADTVETSFAIFEEASSWNLGDKLPNVYCLDTDLGAEAGVFQVGKSTEPTVVLSSTISEVEKTHLAIDSNREVPGAFAVQVLGETSSKRRDDELPTAYGLDTKLESTSDRFQVDKTLEPTALLSPSKSESTKISPGMKKDDGEVPKFPAPPMDDRMRALESCYQNGLTLRYFSDKFRDNWLVVLNACKQNGLALQYASKRLQSDHYMVQIACEQKFSALECASDAARNDKEVIMSVCAINGLALRYASKALRKDQDVLKIACRQNISSLQYASDKALDDKEVIIDVCLQNGLALEYASAKLRSDKVVVLAACQQNGLALQYASKDLRNDKIVVARACRQNGFALLYAFKELRNDSDVVACACRQNGLVLQYASEELRNDIYVGACACRQNGLALIHASNGLRNEKEMVRIACKQNGSALLYASEELRNNKEVVMGICALYGLAIQYASKELRKDQEVVQIACYQNGLALQYASEELRNDKDMVCNACQQNGLALDFASAQLCNDKIVVQIACQQDGLALQYASKEVRNDRLVVWSACQQNGLALEYASNKLRNDKELVVTACRQNGLALQYASKVLRSDEGVVQTVCEQNFRARKFSSEQYYYYLLNGKKFLKSQTPLRWPKPMTTKLYKKVYLFENEKDDLPTPKK